MAHTVKHRRAGVCILSAGPLISSKNTLVFVEAFFTGRLWKALCVTPQPEHDNIHPLLGAEAVHVMSCCLRRLSSEEESERDTAATAPASLLCDDVVLRSGDAAGAAHTFTAGTLSTGETPGRS